MLNYNFKARLVGNDGFNAVGDGGMGQTKKRKRKKPSDKRSQGNPHTYIWCLKK